MLQIGCWVNNDCMNVEFPVIKRIKLMYQQLEMVDYCTSGSIMWGDCCFQRYGLTLS